MVATIAWKVKDLSRGGFTMYGSNLKRNQQCISNVRIAERNTKSRGGICIVIRPVVAAVKGL